MTVAMEVGERTACRGHGRILHDDLVGTGPRVILSCEKSPKPSSLCQNRNPDCATTCEGERAING